MESGKEPSFSWLVLGKAVFETKEFFGSTTRDVVMGLLLAVLGFANYYRRFGLPAVSDEFISAFYSTFEPLLLVVAAVFIWHLWLAPSAIAYEAARRAMDLERQPLQPLRQPAALAPPPREPAPPNWEIWKRRESWTLNEFGALLAGVEPSEGPLSRDASNYTKLLFDHAKLRKLAHMHEFLDRHSRLPKPIDYNTRISRDVALAWAKEQGLDASRLE